MNSYFKIFTLISALVLSACGGSGSTSNSNNENGGIDLSNYDVTAFITTWKTDNEGASNDDQITITTSTPDQNYTVDWGDDSQDTGVTGDITHTYVSSGTYVVVITGDFTNIEFTSDSDSEKLLSVEQWGGIKWSTMLNAFRYCTNLALYATDAPDLSRVTSMTHMFEDAENLNSDLNHWDVSTIKGMYSTFKGATTFNGDISSWDVSSATTMGYMFEGAAAFNSDVSQWNVSSVTNMEFMFDSANAFNQDISLWSVSSVTNMKSMFDTATVFNADIGQWNVSSVTDMYAMFSNAKGFNQDIGNWNVSDVTDMYAMFNQARSFEQNIGNWDVSSVTDMEYMFNGVTLTTANYDALLQGWSNLSLRSNVVFGGGNSTYSSASDTAISTLANTYGWTITDGGAS
jgi:surface protein